MKRRFRFGVVVRKAETGKDWTERARLLEDAGVDVLLVPDHVLGARFGPIAAMTAAAAVTTTLRVGTMVFSNDYRHPVILAKELASIDVLSDGRLEVGMGTGWMRSDYDASGIEFTSPKTRFERFQESIHVLKGAWTQDDFSFAGEHYTVRGLTQDPKPVQRPHPPLVFPGGGPRMIRLAAREGSSLNVTMAVKADGSGPDPRDGGLRAFLDKIAFIRDAAGERAEELELSVSVSRIGAPSEQEWSAADMSQQGETPQVLLGSTTDIVDKMRYWRDEHGISHFILHNDKDLDLFLPAVRELSGR